MIFLPDNITHGADEEELVNSGLEEIMINAYQEIREAWKQKNKIPDLRTAAFVVAIEKITNSYVALVIFPQYLFMNSYNQITHPGCYVLP